MTRFVLSLAALLLASSAAVADVVLPPPPPPPPPATVEPAVLIAGFVASAGVMLAGLWFARRSRLRAVPQG